MEVVHLVHVAPREVKDQGLCTIQWPRAPDAKKVKPYKRGCKINSIARPPLVQHLARKGLVHDVHHLHHASKKAAGY